MSILLNSRHNRCQERNLQAHWVVATLVLASLPSLLHLPLWVAVVALLGTGLHYAGGWRNSWYGKGVSALLLGATASGIWLSFDSWFSGDAVLSFFIAVVFLKWGESRTRRDYLLLVFAAVILAAVGSLYWETLLSLLHMFVVVLALTASLVAINAGEFNHGWYLILRRSAGLFLLGLPVMLLLFLTFPRIPGPLWDIGLAFGLPVKAMLEKGNSDFGKSKVLQPGGFQRFSRDDGTVLVAEFRGVVPRTHRLYWRGPVFWDYDGESWHLPDNWDNRARLLKRAIRSKQKLERELRWKREPVHYNLRVMPNGGRWLYGLDVPAAPAPEAFISDEFQLLSIRKIDDHEPKLEMLAYLEYGIGAELTQEQREKGLAWPQGTNPRLYALGRELREKYREPGTILHQARVLVTIGNFRLDPAHTVAPGPDMLDRFFFEDKTGGAEYFASSFAMLMRAAGVPARLVSGFHGGTIVALTDFVIVKRSHLYAWVEVWDADKGWSRVDPAGMIVSLEERKKKTAPDESEESALQVRIKKTQQIEEESGQKKVVEGEQLSVAEEKSGEGWGFPDWSSLFGGLQKWVIDYDPDRQVELLQEVGVENSNWLDLLIGAFVGVFLLLVLYLSVALWRGRRRIDPARRAWRQFCALLAKRGLKRKDYECPRDYLRRLSRERPEYAAAAADITERYIAIRYGEDKSAQAAVLLRRQVKRFISMV